MHVALGILAAAVFAADSPTECAAPRVSYDVKFLEMSGLEWRSGLYLRLEPVSRQGAATVWTASSDVVPLLVQCAKSCTNAPSQCADADAQAVFFDRSARKVVTEVKRAADGPVNHASYVGYAPKVELEPEGVSTSISGRSLDQGVLAKVAMIDRQILAVHPLVVSEARESSTGSKAEKMSVTLEVPEITGCEVAGEWLIPNDGVLVVSFGAHTTAEKDGKAKVCERLAVIAAKPSTDGAAMRTGYTLPTVVAPRFHWSVPTLPIPMPAMPSAVVPSRSLPQAMSAGGAPTPLPPLPEEIAPPTAFPDSLEPCASPQSKDSKSGDDEPDAKTHDPVSRRASYDEESMSTNADSKVRAPAAAAGWLPVFMKALYSKVPLSAHIDIEINTDGKPSTVKMKITNQE
jgi:hypothetical protein